MVRLLVAHDTDPQIVVELADNTGEGWWDGRCRHPQCGFRVSEGTGGFDNLTDATQEAIVHVDHHSH